MSLASGSAALLALEAMGGGAASGHTDLQSSIKPELLLDRETCLEKQQQK